MKRSLVPAAMALLPMAFCAVALAADPVATEPRQLNLTESADESDPALARIQDGGFAVVYETDGHDTELENRLLMRRFASDGSPLDLSDIGASEENPVETNENNTNDQAAIAGNADGRVVVAWTTYNPETTGMDVMYRVWNNAGTAITGESDVWPIKDGAQEHPDVDVAPDGTFVIVWNVRDDDGDGPETDGAIYARRFHADGSPMTDREFVGYTQTDDGEPAVSVDAGGGFVVGWNDYRIGSKAMIRRFVTSQPPGQALQLAPVGDAVDVGAGISGLHSHPQPLLLADRVLVTWTVTVGTPGVFARRFSSALEPVGGPVPMTPFASSFQSNSEIAQAADGSVGIAWVETSDVQWRRFDADLTPLTGAITVTDYSESTNPIVGSGNQFVVGWEGETDPPAAVESEIYARRYVVGDLTSPPDDPGGDPPPTTTPPVTTAPPATNPPPALLPLPRFSAISRFPKACKDRRLRLKFRHPAGLKLASVVIKVNGKRKKTLKAPGTAKLTKLPKRRVKLAVAVKLLDGRTVKATKRYSRCR